MTFQMQTIVQKPTKARKIRIETTKLIKSIVIIGVIGDSRIKHLNG